MKKTNLQWDELKPDPEHKYYDARRFLLADEDSAFLKSAYKCILKRVPDENGCNSYHDWLSKGGFRQQVLAALLLSEEGKAHAVTLTHLRSFLAWAILRRKNPWLGRMLAPAFWLLKHCLNFIQHYQALQLRTQFARENEIKIDMGKTRQKVEPVLHRIETLEHQNTALRSQLHLLKNAYLVAGRDDQQAYAPARPDLPPPEQEPQQKKWQEEFSNFYLEFEIAFRGRPEAIRERLEHYLSFLPPPVLDECSKVVDLGCGRGEWLSLLQESGYTPWGLDSSPVMLEICREQGLNVSEQPMHLWLQRQPDASIAAITAFHLAEHLPFEYLLALIREAKRLLLPGGVLILETQNPESLRVSAYAFYHDPTHRNPLTPELLEFTARYMGFAPVQLEKLSEVPLDLQISEATEAAVQLNQLLNAPRDLALIAFQPDDTRETAERP